MGRNKRSSKEKGGGSGDGDNPPPEIPEPPVIHEDNVDDFLHMYDTNMRYLRMFLREKTIQILSHHKIYHFSVLPRDREYFVNIRLLVSINGENTELLLRIRVFDLYLVGFRNNKKQWFRFENEPFGNIVGDPTVDDLPSGANYIHLGRKSVEIALETVKDDVYFLSKWTKGGDRGKLAKCMSHMIFLFPEGLRFKFIPISIIRNGLMLIKWINSWKDICKVIHIAKRNESPESKLLKYQTGDKLLNLPESIEMSMGLLRADDIIEETVGASSSNPGPSGYSRGKRGKRVG